MEKPKINLFISYGHEKRNARIVRALMEDNETGDSVLDAYLDMAGQKILNRMYPFKTDYTGLEVPDRYVSVQLKISSYLLLKRGAEGQIQHIENGIHRDWYSSDDRDLLSRIIPYASVR